MTTRPAQWLPSHSLSGRFARGAMWSLMGTLIAQGLGVIASIVTARLLGKVGFGEFGMVNSTLGSFGAFAGLGLGLTATKYVAEWRGKDPARAGRILGLSSQVALVSGGVVALILFIFAPALAARTLNAPMLVLELRMGCVLLFLNALNGAQTGALSGLEAFKTITKVNLIRGLLNFPLMIGGVWFFGLAGAVAATVAVGAAGWAMNQVALRRHCAKAGIVVSHRGTRADYAVLWKFSLPAFLSGVMVGPVLWAANTILVHQPGGYGELGLLNAANQWRTAMMFLPSVFMQVALPLMASSLDAETHPGDYGKTLVITQSLTVAVVLPIGTLLMFLSDWIMGLYGTAFSGGSLVLIGVVCSIMVNAIGSASGAAIEAKGRMWLAFLFNLSWGLILIVVAWLTAPVWGANGLAFASAAAYTTLTVWGFLYIARDLPAGMLRRVLLAVGYAVCLAATCALLTPRTRQLLAIPAEVVTISLTVAALVDPRLRRVALELGRVRLMPKAAPLPTSPGNG